MTTKRKPRLIPLDQLTRPRLQRWLDAQPPRGLVAPDSSCACIIAQHMGCTMSGYDEMVRDESSVAVPEWAVWFQKLASDAADNGRRYLPIKSSLGGVYNTGAITWARAARILREMPK